MIHAIVQHDNQSRLARLVAPCSGLILRKQPRHQLVGESRAADTLRGGEARRGGRSERGKRLGLATGMQPVTAPADCDCGAFLRDILPRGSPPSAQSALSGRRALPFITLRYMAK